MNIIYILKVYIHQNPQKRGLIDDFRKWSNSSYREAITLRTSLVNRKEVKRWLGDSETSIASHQIAVNLKVVSRFVDYDQLLQTSYV